MCVLRCIHIIKKVRGQKTFDWCFWFGLATFTRNWSLRWLGNWCENINRGFCLVFEWIFFLMYLMCFRSMMANLFARLISWGRFIGFLNVCSSFSSGVCEQLIPLTLKSLWTINKKIVAVNDVHVRQTIVQVQSSNRLFFH